MLPKGQLLQQIRRHASRELYDESLAVPAGFAIYSLADPREIRRTRYIGQTSLPRRRFLQHLNTARLWLPAERPWWVPAPRLRPLYDWIRQLYLDEARLPTMVVHAWVPTLEDARLAERASIYRSIADQLPLLNVEKEILGEQMPLI